MVTVEWFRKSIRKTNSIGGQFFEQLRMMHQDRTFDQFAGIDSADFGAMSTNIQLSPSCQKLLYHVPDWRKIRELHFPGKVAVHEDGSMHIEEQNCSFACFERILSQSIAIHTACKSSFPRVTFIKTADFGADATAFSFIFCVVGQNPAG